MDRRVVSGVTGIAAGLLVVVGTFLPWLAYTGAIALPSLNGFSGTRDGTASDGVVTLVVGLVIVAAWAAHLMTSTKRVPLISGIAGIVAMGIAFYQIDDIGQSNAQLIDVGAVQVGNGLYVVGLGGLVATLLAMAEMWSTKAEPITTWPCPFCAEEIKVEAVVCRYCSRDLPTGWSVPDVPTKETS